MVKQAQSWGEALLQIPPRKAHPPITIPRPSTDHPSPQAAGATSQSSHCPSARLDAFPLGPPQLGRGPGPCWLCACVHVFPCGRCVHRWVCVRAHGGGMHPHSTNTRPPLGELELFPRFCFGSPSEPRGWWEAALCCLGAHACHRLLCSTAAQVPTVPALGAGAWLPVPPGGLTVLHAA